MTDTIKKRLLPAFTSSQKFLVKLLYDFYEDKMINNEEEKANLNEDNKKMKNQILLLREANRQYEEKLRTAYNMIRLLSKTKEFDAVCTTPTSISILKAESLICQKVNDIETVDKTFVNNNFHLKQRRLNFDSTNKTVEPKKVLGKAVKPKFQKTETKKMETALNKIREQNKEKKLPSSKNEVKRKPFIIPLKVIYMKDSPKNVQMKNKNNLGNIQESTKEKNKVHPKVDLKDVKKKRLESKQVELRSRKVLNNTYV